MKAKISDLESKQNVQNEMKKDFEKLQTKISNLENLQTKAQNFLTKQENVNGQSNDYLETRKKIINNKK